MSKRKHICTGHNIKLCPDVKELVDIKRASMRRTRTSINYSEVLTAIILEWSMKKP